MSWRWALPAIALGLMLCPKADAHFPFLVVDDGQTQVFFGEDLTDRTYTWPEAMNGLEIRCSGSSDADPLTLKPVDSDDLVGLAGEAPEASAGVLFGTQAYGLYHGRKLVYCVQHHLGKPQSAGGPWHASQPLSAIPQQTSEGIAWTCRIGDEPLGEVEVTVAGTGDQSVTKSTDADGVVRFTHAELGGGLQVLRVGTTVEEAGEFAGEAYEATMFYLTATWKQPASDTNAKTAKMKSKPAGASAASASVQVVDTKLPELPSELTSFGGVLHDDTVYLYGGHTGNAHSYSTTEQSGTLHVLDLKSDAPSWQSFDGGPRLQGLAMVELEGQIIRLGGFTARNDEGEDHDLHSRDLVSRWDAEGNAWQPMTPLPEPRSSFAAATLDGSIYVVGGWAMAGDKETVWHETAWRGQMHDGKLKWTAIAEPPFQRRALSVAAHDGKIYVLGGMQEAGGPTTRLDVYDPQTDTWSEGPALEGGPMAGFGVWAHAYAGQLYASTVSGTVQRLSDDGESWETVAEYDPGRFFHVMLPHRDRGLLVIGGANMEIGRFTDIQRVKIDR